MELSRIIEHQRRELDHLLQHEYDMLLIEESVRQRDEKMKRMEETRHASDQRIKNETLARQRQQETQRSKLNDDRDIQARLMQKQLLQQSWQESKLKQDLEEKNKIESANREQLLRRKAQEAADRRSTIRSCMTAEHEVKRKDFENRQAEAEERLDKLRESQMNRIESLRTDPDEYVSIKNLRLQEADEERRRRFEEKKIEYEARLLAKLNNDKSHVHLIKVKHKKFDDKRRDTLTRIDSLEQNRKMSATSRLTERLSSVELRRQDIQELRVESIRRRNITSAKRDVNFRENLSNSKVQKLQKHLEEENARFRAFKATKEKREKKVSSGALTASRQIAMKMIQDLKKRGKMTRDNIGELVDELNRILPFQVTNPSTGKLSPTGKFHTTSFFDEKSTFRNVSSLNDVCQRQRNEMDSLLARRGNDDDDGVDGQVLEMTKKHAQELEDYE